MTTETAEKEVLTQETVETEKPIQEETAPGEEAVPVEEGKEETPKAEEPPKQIKYGDVKYTRATQERMNELIRTRSAEKERADRLEARLREVEKKIGATEKPTPPSIKAFVNEIGEINEADYKRATETYETNLLQWSKAQQKIETPTSEQLEAGPSPQIFIKRGEELKKQYPDYDETINVPVFTPTMQQVLLNMDLGADIAYYLGKNPGEAMRIGALPPLQIGIELGKLNAKFSAQSPAKTSGAIPPITPLKGADSVSKDPSAMSTEEWMAWNKQKELDRIKRKLNS